MTINSWRKWSCALLAALMLVTAAVPTLAEESGNPFDVPAGFDTDATATPIPAATVVPVPTATINAVDLFNLGTPTPAPDAGIGTNAGADPFGGAFTAAPTLEPGISGYNPFDPDSTVEPAATPMNLVMYVTAATTAIRRKASSQSDLMTTVPFGEQLQVVALDSNWARVVSGKRTGYCRAEELSTENPNTMQKAMYVQPKRVAMTRMPLKKSGVIRRLNMGETVTVTAISSDGLWARVTDGSRFGFVPSYALDDVPASQGGTPMWVGVGVADVMINPDNWVKMGSISIGQSVSLVGYIENNTIAKIRSASGYVAYCAAAALVASNPLTMNTQVYTQVGGKILYRAAGGGQRAGNIGKNASLTLLGVDTTQTWAVVKFGGKRYYTPYVFVGTTRLGNANRVVVTTEETGLMRTSTEAVATLPAGTRLYLMGISDSVAAVTTISDGVTPTNSGFISPEYLRGEQP